MKRHSPLFAGWIVVGVALIIAYAFASAAIARSVLEFNDVAHHVDFTIGVLLPLHVVWQALGGWRLTVCLWALVAGLAIAGTQSVKALGDAARPKTIVAVQVILLAALLAVTVTFSGDVYAYVIYGRLYALHGVNPYLLGSALQPQADDALRTCLAFYGNPPPADNYGPLWTLLAGGISRLEAGAALGAQVWTHRVVAAAAAVASTLGMLRLLRGVDAAERAKRVAGFALHPLVLYEAAVGGHNDLLMIAPAVWAFALAEELPLVAGLLLGASIAVKYVSLLLVPFLAIRAAKRGRSSAVLSAIIACALPVLFFQPFWSGAATLYSLIGHGGVLAMSPQWLIDIPIFASGAADKPALGAFSLPLFGEPSWPRLIQLAALACLFMVLVVSVARYARRCSPGEIWRTVTTSVLTLSVIHPWYALWMTPAAIDRGRWGTYAWWFGILVFVRYALDGIAPVEAGRFYTPLLAVLTVVMLLVPAWLAIRDKHGQAPPARLEVTT